VPLSGGGLPAKHDTGQNSIKSEYVRWTRGPLASSSP